MKNIYHILFILFIVYAALSWGGIFLMCTGPFGDSVSKFAMVLRETVLPVEKKIESVG